ncbi:cytosolic sulfotransferase 15-like [Prosopis cineraria]|uniref:cytosolic sulfotransferase 15-like n=1 Tax=Prosopis cineraria TaxID=364024 RepID=UPI00240EEF2D|nr:cytosolic sulfotransferase 15-like [Prosopis cineraria]
MEEAAALPTPSTVIGTNAGKIRGEKTNLLGSSNTLISEGGGEENGVKASSLPKLSWEEAFDRYSKGINEFGLLWTNILGYWWENKLSPNKILCLRYEDLKGDIKFYLKTVAVFLDCPFNAEEERDGVIENIIELCSFQKMKDLEVNKTGKRTPLVENKDFFRKGEVGDWVNHFSSWMTEKLSKVMEQKLDGSGLSFQC